jgi:hypothetical protein
MEKLKKELEGENRPYLLRICPTPKGKYDCICDALNDGWEYADYSFKTIIERDATEVKISEEMNNEATEIHFAYGELSEAKPNCNNN